MTTLLKISTSARSNGNANRLADELVDAWIDSRPETQVQARDFGREPLPHLSEDEINAFFTPAEARTPEQQELVRVSDELIAELQAADVLVLSVPMYNFGIPSTLKAYFDRLARAGITFKYTSEGPVGLVTGKKAYVVAARGGVYAGTPKDTQSAYLRDFLGFIGITDVEFIYAEGLNLGDDRKTQAEAQARQQIQRLVAA